MKFKRNMTESELAEYRAYREARKFARNKSTEYAAQFKTETSSIRRK